MWTWSGLSARVRSAATAIAPSCSKAWSLFTQLIRDLWAQFAQFFLSVWHGSVRWGWFAVLLVGAYTFTASGEFGAGFVLFLLTFFSLGSKFGHRTRALEGPWVLLAFVVYPALLTAAVLSFFYTNDLRNGAPWSQIPRAWDQMLIAAEFRVQALPLPPAKTPEPPDGWDIYPPPSTPDQGAPPAAPPDVALSFVYRESPTLVIINKSGGVARDMKWAVVLWNLNHPDDLNPLPIPTGTFDWLKGHAKSASLGLFIAGVASTVKVGDHLLGSASIDCPTCTRGRTYFVSITYGLDGWFAEIPNAKTGGPAYPPKFSRESLEQYFRAVEATPTQLRQPISDP
jgi:hypothetical protein